jgi:uncharacterized protein
VKILVVGISVRAMVESAVGSQYSVTALDAFGDQDLRAIAETRSLRHDFGVPYSANALYEFSRQLGSDVMAYTSNLENHPETLERFAGDRCIIGNSPQALRSIRHWPSLFPRLRQAGFGVPETMFPDSEQNFDAGQKWLLKPIMSGGGNRISYFHGQGWPRDRMMLQQYISGKACSASFVSNGIESVILGVTEQLIGVREFGAHGFRYCGNILPLPEILDADSGGTILKQVRRAAEFLTREYRLTGVNGFDFILDRGKVWLTEVNPRYSASMELIECAYRLPIFHLHMQAALESRVPEFKLESLLNGAQFFGKSIMFCEKKSTAPDLRTLGFKDIPAPGEILHEGSPVCTLLSSRSSYQETMADLISQAEMLKGMIYC